MIRTARGSQASASLAVIEAGVAEHRRCPDCGTLGAASRGLRWYQCKNCGNTFNAATSTPPAGLHHKERWLEFGTCLAERETVRAPVGRCGLAVKTAFRWRHRLLAAESQDPPKLAGIVEADETYLLESRKGERHLGHKAHRRGGKASERGLSSEQVPVLVSADHSGKTVSAVLPAVNADTLQKVIEPVVDDDIVLIGDGLRANPLCDAAISVRREAINLSGRELVRNAFRIQIVNSRHGLGLLRGFLRRNRGLATKYLDKYLRWFQQVELNNTSPRTCFGSAIEVMHTICKPTQTRTHPKQYTACAR